MTAPTDTPKTVRVCIAVAVNKDGKWRARASSSKSAGDSMEEALVWMSDDAIVHWVEAEVPLPVRQVIQGEVKP